MTCTYQWDFGDGSTAVGLSVKPHLDLAPGVYTSTLKANNDELSDTETLTVTVNAGGPVVVGRIPATIAPCRLKNTHAGTERARIHPGAQRRSHL